MMIQAPSELLSFQSLRAGQLGPGEPGLAQAERKDATPDGPGAVSAFDDLVAAALQPGTGESPIEAGSSIAAKPNGLGSQWENALRIAPQADELAPSGSILPGSGKDVPQLPHQPPAAPPVLQTAPPLEAAPEESQSLQGKDVGQGAASAAIILEPGLSTQEVEAESDRPAEQPEAADVSPRAAAEQIDTVDTRFDADLRVLSGDSQKPPSSHQTQPAENPAVLAAMPVPPRHSRADQPVAEQSRTGTPTTPPKEGAPAAPVNILAEREAKVRPEPLAARASDPAAPAPLMQTALPANDPGQGAQAQPASTLAAPAIQTSFSQSQPLADLRGEARIAPQIEQAIDALTGAREAGRASRPEVLVRHREFGLVSMRLETASGDLRATMASRDPGFVPAIHAALNERAVAAASETAANHGHQRGQDQGQGGANSGSFAGFGQNYGSSPGSSQGSSQPRLPQQDGTQREADGNHPIAAREAQSSGNEGGGMFA